MKKRSEKSVMSLYDENVAKGLKAGGSFPASPKSIFQTTYIFAKRPVEIWDVFMCKQL